MNVRRLNAHISLHLNAPQKCCSLSKQKCVTGSEPNARRQRAATTGLLKSAAAVYVRAADHRCCPTTTYPDYIHTIHPNLTPPAQTRAKAYIFVGMPTTVSVNRGAQATPTGEKPARSERKRPPASLNKAVPVRLLRLHHHLARTSRRCSRSHHSATTRTHQDTRLLNSS